MMIKCEKLKRNDINTFKYCSVACSHIRTVNKYLIFLKTVL
jgi:hypothetical protein